MATLQSLLLNIHIYKKDVKSAMPSLSSKWLKDARKGLAIISFSQFGDLLLDSLHLPPQPSATTDHLLLFK